MILLQSYSYLVIKVTLTGTSQSSLITCKHQIETLARTCSHKAHLTDQTELATWPQTTINKYYEFCLQKRVLPTIDIDRSIIDLIGPKDAVRYAHIKITIQSFLFFRYPMPKSTIIN